MASPEAPPVQLRSGRTDRFVVAVLSLVLLLVGLAGLLSGSDSLRMLGWIPYLLVGSGAAFIGHWTRLKLSQRLAISILLSLSVLAFVSGVMLVTGQWHPGLTFGLVGVGTGAAHLDVIRRGVRADENGRAWSWSSDVFLPSARYVPLLGMAVVGGALSIVAAGQVTPSADGVISPVGFLQLAGPVWLIGIALLLVSVVLALRQSHEWIMVIVIVLFVVTLTASPALLFDQPRIPSAFKHAELVSQIQDTGHIFSSARIYENWPGFFSSLAWLCDVTGIRDPVRLATWWPLVIGLLRLVALRYMFGRMLSSKVQIWIAVLLAILADTVGQDYFSPQSVGLVLALICYGLAFDQLGAARIILLLDAGIVLAFTHQISPYMVAAALVALVVWRRIRPWWTPGLVVIPAVMWAVVHWSDVSQYVYFGGIGRTSNFLPPPTSSTAGLDRLPVVAISTAATALGVTVLVLLALAALVRQPKDRATWTYLSCAAVGLMPVALNPYGNEGIFRALLFAIPWLAVVASGALLRSSGSYRLLLAPGVLVVLTATYLVAPAGLDGANVLRRGDIASARYLEQAAARGPIAVIPLGAGSQLPIPLLADVKAVDRRAIGLPVVQEDSSSLPTVVPRVTDAVLEYVAANCPAGTRVYALWSPASAAYGSDYGIQSAAQAEYLRDMFASSSQWKVVTRNEGSVLLQLTY